MSEQGRPSPRLRALPLRVLRWLCILPLCVVLLGAASARAEDSGHFATLRIQQAMLSSVAGDQTVSLPHVLDATQFPPAGGLVRYRLAVDIAQLPARPLAIFPLKMSLAGRVWLNGELVGACEQGEPDRVRCLHHPYLFVPPPSLWRSGNNQIEFEIYANRRQDSGLATVLVGDAETLYDGPYARRHWVQVVAIESLSWLALQIGVLSLAIGLLLRREPIYLWFGLASLLHAASNLNWIVTRPAVHIDLFSWFVFVSRYVNGALLLAALALAFEQMPRRFPAVMAAIALGGSIVIALSGNDRSVVVALYVPLLLISIAQFGLMAWWCRRQATAIQRVFTLLLGVIVAVSVVDWLRLAGAQRFEGIYLMSYTFGLVLVAMGVILVGQLAAGLVRSRELSAELETKVAERSAELEHTYARLLAAERERSRTEERERMLQDMHDGFGSHLASARVMVEQQRIGPAEVSRMLSECLADLHLMVDTLSARDEIALSALSDLRFRVQQQVAGLPLAVHWNIDIDDMPDLPPNTMLQLLRIVQEALNNVLRHAEARHVWIDARYLPDEHSFVLRVGDDGKGLPAERKTGRGLANMMQRARTIGAHLKVGTHVPAGTEVEVRLPLAPDAD